MADLGKVGEKGPRPPEDPKRKKGPDSEAFREMMKVGKVRETDPDEQSKGKSQAEAEEDFAADQAGSSLSQGLGSEAPPPPFFSEGTSDSQVDTSQTQIPSNLPPSQPSSASSGSGPEDSGPIDGPQASQRAQQSQQPQHSQQRQKSHEASQADKKKKEKKTEAKPKEAITAPTAKPKSEKATKAKKKAAIDPHMKTPDPKHHKKDTEEVKAPQKTDELTKLPGAKEEVKVDKPEKEEKKTKEVAQQLEGVVQKPLPPGGWEAVKETEKKDDVTTTPVQVEAQTPDLQSAPQTPEVQETPPPSTAPFANLPPQVAQLFERMVGVMTVMQQSGIKETTITLDNPQFAKSVFFGSQIVITEYSTAPLEYNIELSGNQQAVDLMGANANELVAAFEAGKYNFKVHRLDLSQQGSIAEVRRKEMQKVKRKKTGGG